MSTPLTRQDEANIAFARFLEKHRARVRPRLTQNQLSQDAGVSPTYLNRLLRYEELLRTGGDRVQRPDPETITGILQVVADYLREPQLVNEGLRILGYDPSVYGTAEPMRPETMRLMQVMEELPEDDYDLIRQMIERAYERLQR